MDTSQDYFPIITAARSGNLEDVINLLLPDNSTEYMGKSYSDYEVKQAVFYNAAIKNHFNIVYYILDNNIIQKDDPIIKVVMQYLIRFDDLPVEIFNRLIGLFHNKVLEKKYFLKTAVKYNRLEVVKTLLLDKQLKLNNMPKYVFQYLENNNLLTPF
jgi:hypothetical protein